jgi:hypothetical protein
MTLAVIFLCSLLPLGPDASSGANSAHAYSQASANPATDSQNQGSSPQPQAPSGNAQPAQPSSSTSQNDKTQKPVKKKMVHHKKKMTKTCPATETSSASGSSTEASSSGGTASNCPPPKIVVRQGGTSEPSIQLAGGDASGQASQQKNNANQMLGTTEENLKKLTGRQLNATEQDMVTQIRQFMEQAKTAVAAGDPERARTLAWKAQTLSEDLTKPKE